jgi:hypothetical protein
VLPEDTQEILFSIKSLKYFEELKITDFSERLLEKHDNFVYKRHESATESPVDISAITLKLFIEGSLRSFGLEF